MWRAPPETPPTPAWTPPVQPTAAAYVEFEEGPNVRVHFHSVSSLYRRFFSDKEALARVAEAAAPCVSGELKLVVTYDETRRRGKLVAVIPTEALGCRPEQSAEGLDMRPMTPVGRAVAALRDHVAETKDLRVYGLFDLGVHVYDGAGGLTWWAKGDHPTSGTRMAGCVGLDGFLQCAEAEDRKGLTTLALPTPEHQARAVAVLRAVRAAP